MNSYQIDRALKNVFDYLSQVNAYVDTQAPWSLKTTNNERMQNVLYIITLLTIKSSVLLYPVIPSSINKVLNIYSLSIKNLNLTNLLDFLPANIHINKTNPIFPRIEL